MLNSVGQMTIDVLPSNVLLDIFDFCLDQQDPGAFLNRTSMWQKLVHVCQKWRDVVLQSPRRLHLQICCTSRSPVREKLDIWPAFPLVIWVNDVLFSWSMENVIAAFKHSNRIDMISSDKLLSSPSLLSMMLKPFPALKYLALESFGRIAPDIPDSFYGWHVAVLHESPVYPTVSRV